MVDLGPIMLDAERCVLCSRCLRFEDVVTGTNSLQFVSRGDHTSISTFDGSKIEHDYAGNLADVCPVGALLSKDFRFKMRVWFLKEHESVCPGCSTGCNVYVDERDGEVQRLRARRNPDVNKSWLCDPGRALYKQIGVTERVSGARVRGAGGWAGTTVAAALDRVAAALKDAGAAAPSWRRRRARTRTCSPSRRWPRRCGGKLDFRVGDPQLKVQQKLDNVLQHVDRNPNTQGCLDQGVGRDGVDTILAACRAGSLKALVLQGPELLRVPEAVDAIAKVPFVAVMATHEGPELDRATVVLPAAMWAEVSGTFTNFQRRVQRLTSARAAAGRRAAAPRAGGRPAVAPRQAARRRERARGVRARREGDAGLCRRSTIAASARRERRSAPPLPPRPPERQRA